MSETDRTQEYNSLVSQQSAKEREYAACQARINANNYLIDRLVPVRDKVSALKGRYVQLEKTDKSTINDKYDWKGSNRTRFDKDGDSIIDENLNYRKYSLDKVLDELNNEITRLKNLNLSEYGLLGKIGAAINSLANAIRNFWN